MKRVLIAISIFMVLALLMGCPETVEQEQNTAPTVKALTETKIVVQAPTVKPTEPESAEEELSEDPVV